VIFFNVAIRAPSTPSYSFAIVRALNHRHARRSSGAAALRALLTYRIGAPFAYF